MKNFIFHYLCFVKGNDEITVKLIKAHFKASDQSEIEQKAKSFFGKLIDSNSAYKFVPLFIQEEGKKFGKMQLAFFQDTKLSKEEKQQLSEISSALNKAILDN